MQENSKNTQTHMQMREITDSYSMQQNALRTYFHYDDRMKNLLKKIATTHDPEERQKALFAAEKVSQKILVNLLIAQLRLSAAGGNSRKGQSVEPSLKQRE